MKKLLLFLLLFSAALAGIAAWYFFPRSYTLTEAKLTSTPMRFGDMHDAVSATGRIEPLAIIAVSCEVPGQVTDLKGAINMEVTAETELARLDDSKLKRERDEAQSGKKAAEASLAQAEASLTKAKAALAQANAALNQARAALAQANSMKKATDLGLDYQVDINKKGGFRSELDQAKIKVEAAEAGVEAAHAGVESAQAGVGAAQAGVEAAQAGVAVAQSQVEASKASLGKATDALAKTIIRLPVNCDKSCKPSLDHATTEPGNTTNGLPDPPGPAADPCCKYIILDRQVRLGQFVSPQGPPLFLVTSELKTIEIHAEVAEADIAKVRPGLTASFSVQSYIDKDVFFKGVVKEIRPQGISSKGAVYYIAVINVINEKDPASGEWRLRPGMTASIDIIRAAHKGVWSVPVSAINFQMDEAYYSDAARKKIAEWSQRPDYNLWQKIWTWDAQNQAPQPIFVRLDGVNKAGEPGLKDGDYNEILEWEAGQQPNSPQTAPQIIIGVPPAHSQGFFDKPLNLKVS